ncbi:MAG: acyl CoA:acetate/3-ketoacid CoA transferase, partial [Pseudomonadota bacterium]
KDVRVPGILVDCVVVADPADMHRMNYGEVYNAALAGEIRVPVEAVARLPLNERKIIARRAAFELPPNGVINLGVGAPDGVAAVANEEQVTPHIVMTTEAGAVGGVLASGSRFGASVNAHCIIDQNQMFDFYHGGGLDLTCLGMAECDRSGNVNTSRFGGRLNGCGGFIDISQNSRAVVFAGTFTAGGLKIEIKHGEVRIVQEGRARKFVKKVDQITFSGTYAAMRQQPVLYVTERCVFQLTMEGMELIEVAPGIEIERDIIQHMDFMPVIKAPIEMNARIFKDEPMELLGELTNRNLDERVNYDGERNILFINLEGWSVRKQSDIDDLRSVLVDACEVADKRVNAISNQDGCRIADDLQEDFVAMIAAMTERYFATISRYSTSAFMRVKMGKRISQRGQQPHIFESGHEARASADMAYEDDWDSLVNWKAKG